MKKALYFAFLAFALVQGHQVVHKRMITSSQVTELSTNAALSKLMTEKKKEPISLISQACRYDMGQQCKQWQKTEKAYYCYFSQKTCYVIGTPTAFAVYVLSKTKSGDYKEVDDLPGSEEVGNLQKYQAVWLPFVENQDTFTILDPGSAPWFFTARLGGCDMFVATVENQGNKPLVVHSNRNVEKVDAVENLKLKEQLVDPLITSVNAAYNVIARVHWTSTDPEDKEKINQHLSEYAATPGHEGIVSFPYDSSMEPIDSDGFHFFGHYDGKWTFVLKGIASGQIFYTFSVSANGKVE